MLNLNFCAKSVILFYIFVIFVLEVEFPLNQKWTKMNWDLWRENSNVYKINIWDLNFR